MVGTIAILPIKEHSARVPNKNFRDLGGYPLWLWPARICYLCDLIDLVIIDTDSPNVLTAEVPDWLTPEKFIFRSRPAALQGDDVSMNRIIAAIVQDYAADVYVQVHATNPFLDPATIRWAYELLCFSCTDSIWAATKHQARFYDRKGLAFNHDPKELLPTQRLEPIYQENSSLYVFRREAFRKDGKRICGKSGPLSINPLEAIDIDTVETWELAQIVARGLRETKKDIWTATANERQ